MTIEETVRGPQPVLGGLGSPLAAVLDDTSGRSTAYKGISRGTRPHPRAGANRVAFGSGKSGANDPRSRTIGIHLYLGNLDRSTTEETLRELLSRDGRTVASLLVKTDKAGRSRGFAFAAMGSEEEVEAAIAALDGTEVDGARIKVNHGHEKPIRTAISKPSSFGGFSGGGSRGKRR